MSVSAAIVGVGALPYYRRGESVPQTPLEMVCKAILLGLEDAGLTVQDLNGFAYYSGGYDTALIAQILGVPEVTYTASLTGYGGGPAGSVGLAASAVTSGLADVVVSVMAVQQSVHRMGAAVAASQFEGDTGGGPYGVSATPERDFFAYSGVVSPSQLFALLAQRHMALYGTTREHFAEVAISTRLNAVNRPEARMRTPLTVDDYFNARMISDPLCLLDCCLETDGAIAVITTSEERARDLRHPPVRILSSAHGGAGRWGQSVSCWFGMPDEYFASSGHRPVARRLYERAGLGPQDVDVALIYDHFSPMVLMQLEDYGFCGIGESGDFVADGNIRLGGALPVNTHGGHLSEAYLIGMTHVREGVEQIRGTATNQVAGAEVALVTGGPAPIPVSALLLGRS